MRLSDEAILDIELSVKPELVGRAIADAGYDRGYQDAKLEDIDELA